MKTDEKNNKIILADRGHCTGCLSCANVCRVNAIKIKTDREGFYYPVIFADRCIKCGKCMEACYILHEHPKKDRTYEMKSYFGKHNCIKEQETSQSGGAFWAIAEQIYSEHGIVYGAALDSNQFVKHIRTNNIDEGRKLKGSKYVQSYIGTIYRQVEKDLLLNRKVLFSGTPCQVAGLYSLLAIHRIPMDNLITCDLVCHGVPSPRVWRDYINYTEAKYGKKILVAKFRDKKFGWGSHRETFQFQNNTAISKTYYAELFYNNCILRPACGNCIFCNTNRVADLTLADCWGIEKYNKKLFDIKGVSLVLVNTAKGEEVLDKIKSGFSFLKINLRYVIQHNLKEPTPVSPKRTEFWNDYNKKGFNHILRKYTSHGIFNQIRSLAKGKSNL